MKKLLFLFMFAVLTVVAVNAKATDYLVEDGDYFSTVSLFNNDTLLMTGWTGELLTLSDSSVATIENTEPLDNALGDGGIWEVGVGGFGILNLYGGEINKIEACNKSIIDMTGGSVNSLEMYSNSMSYLYGGDIGTLASAQQIPPDEPEPYGWIHIYCLAGYNYDDSINLLTGQREGGIGFSITLEDIGVYPTYELIEFHIIPEPSTMLLLGLGGLWLGKKRSL